MRMAKKQNEKQLQNPMVFYCPFCGYLVTNAIGKCYSCEDEAQRYQEPWECDEDYSDYLDDEYPDDYDDCNYWEDDQEDSR